MSISLTGKGGISNLEVLDLPRDWILRKISPPQFYPTLITYHPSRLKLELAQNKQMCGPLDVSSTSSVRASRPSTVLMSSNGWGWSRKCGPRSYLTLWSWTGWYFGVWRRVRKKGRRLATSQRRLRSVCVSGRGDIRWNTPNCWARRTVCWRSKENSANGSKNCCGKRPWGLATNLWRSVKVWPAGLEM